MDMCRSLKTVLSAWLETYPNDFREPPEYSTLNSLVQFAICNACDNDFAQKARDQLSAFRECDCSGAYWFWPWYVFIVSSEQNRAVLSLKLSAISLSDHSSVTH